MLAARFSMGPSRVLLVKPCKAPNTTFTKLMSWESRGAGSRPTHAARRRTIKEMAATPTKGTPFNIGQGAVAGASALGLGALAYYGLGLSNEVGTSEKAMFWPKYVKNRIRDTYLYFGGSIAVTATTAAAIFRSPAVMRIVMRQGWVALGVSMAAMVGSGMLVRSIPYEKGFGAKQLAWLGHCAVLGAVIAPICMLGGPILTR